MRVHSQNCSLFFLNTTNFFPLSNNRRISFYFSKPKKRSISMASPALFNSLKPRSRLQKADITAAITWGVAAGTTAFWIVQPFDWIKKTFIDKPQPEA